MRISINKNKEKKLKVSYSKYGYLFIAPFFIVFVIFQLYPILYTIFLSFTDVQSYTNDYNFVGLQNYKDLLGNELFRKAFKNTWIIWMMSFIPQLGLSLFLAAVFTDIKLKIKGQGFFKTLTYLPNIITVASIAILFRSLFDVNGPVNLMLLSIGVIDEKIEFFRSVGFSRGIAAFISFWMWYGYTFIILTAAIVSINPSLYEAAMVDGASSGQMFRKITLPLIKPILLFVLITSLVGGMQMFDVPYLLTNQNGSPDSSLLTMTMFIYNQAFVGSNLYLSATASVFLIIFVALVSVVIFKSFRLEGGKK